MIWIKRKGSTSMTLTSQVFLNSKQNHRPLKLKMIPIQAARSKCCAHIFRGSNQTRRLGSISSSLAIVRNYPEKTEGKSACHLNRCTCHFKTIWACAVLVFLMLCSSKATTIPWNRTSTTFKNAIKALAKVKSNKGSKLLICRRIRVTIGMRSRVRRIWLS